MSKQPVDTQNSGAADRLREPFYKRARSRNLAPLWRVLHTLVTDVPSSSCVAAYWRYSEVRSYLMEACDIISTQEAERRVLVLENPGLAGQSKITPSLFAGLQIILPGEIAPAHRHVASAFRFIIEGAGAYTAVAGEKTTMNRGDFVITPSWTWHDHGNESNEPMIWLDGLDMHIVNLFSASFREDYPGPVHPITRPEGSASAEGGLGLLPVDFERKSQTSPIFNYPYQFSREALDRLSRMRDPDPCHGFKMNYINPLTGNSAMPTLTSSIQLLPKGFTSEAYRSTAATVFSLVEGTASVNVGNERFDLARRDLFVLPSWCSITLAAHSDTILFSYSDRAAQEKLDIYREQRGNG